MKSVKNENVIDLTPKTRDRTKKDLDNLSDFLLLKKMIKNVF